MIEHKPGPRWPLLVALVISGLWFQILEQVIVIPDFFMYVSLDDHIPFLPAFVIPYIFWYGYVAAPAVYLFWKSPGEFRSYARFLAWGMLVACAIYTLFPNGQFLRPRLAGRPGLWTEIIRILYTMDTPTNSAPSIHTVYAVAAHVAFRRANRLFWRKPWLNPLSLAVSVSCILSTVFIKQHSILDLLAGLLLAGILYQIIYRQAANRLVQMIGLNRQATKRKTVRNKRSLRHLWWD